MPSTPPSLMCACQTHPRSSMYYFSFCFSSAPWITIRESMHAIDASIIDVGVPTPHPSSMYSFPVFSAPWIAIRESMHAIDASIIDVGVPTPHPSSMYSFPVFSAPWIAIRESMHAIDASIIDVCARFPRAAELGFKRSANFTVHGRNGFLAVPGPLSCNEYDRGSEPRGKGFLLATRRHPRLGMSASCYLFPAITPSGEGGGVKPQLA